MNPDFLDWLDTISHLLRPSMTVHEARLMYERKIKEEKDLMETQYITTEAAPRKDKQYLGDGVYIANDGYHLVLTTENGIETTNTIYMDGNVVASFHRYIEWLKEKSKLED